MLDHDRATVQFAERAGEADQRDRLISRDSISKIPSPTRR